MQQPTAGKIVDATVKEDKSFPVNTQNNLDNDLRYFREIVRRSLLEKGMPLHYYFEFLLHGSAAVRDLQKIH
jgi:hypothetical protein